MIYRIPCYDNSSIPIGTPTNGSIPNIKGKVGLHSSQGLAPFTSPNFSQGCFYETETPFNVGTNNISSEGSRIEFNAAYTNENCAAVYSDSATLIYPASVKMYIVIKY